VVQPPMTSTSQCAAMYDPPYMIIILHENFTQCKTFSKKIF